MAEMLSPSLHVDRRMQRIEDRALLCGNLVAGECTPLIQDDGTGHAA